LRSLSVVEQKLDIQLKDVLSVVTTGALTGNLDKEKYARLYILVTNK